MNEITIYERERERERERGKAWILVPTKIGQLIPEDTSID